MKKWLAVALLLLGCQRNRPGPPDEGGGMDGGGGTFIFHSREEVIKAANKAWARFTVKRVDNPLAVAHDLLFTKTDAESRNLRVMLLKIMDIPKDHRIIDAKWPDLFSFGGRDESKDFEFTAYVASKKLVFNENDYCKSPVPAHAAASVTRLDRSGEICVSIPALMRMATSGLEADLVALFAHELGHLNGYGEEDCQRLQRYFLFEIATILRKNGEGMKRFFAIDFRSTAKTWRELLTYDLVNDKYAMTVWRRVWNKLAATHGMLPEPFTADDLNVANPDLYGDAWEASAGALTAVAKLSSEGRDQKPGLPPNERILSEIKDAGIRMLAAEKIELEYLYGERADLKENEADRKLLLEATDVALMPRLEAMRECVKGGPNETERSSRGEVSRLEYCLMKIKAPGSEVPRIEDEPDTEGES